MATNTAFYIAKDYPLQDADGKTYYMLFHQSLSTNPVKVVLYENLQQGSGIGSEKEVHHDKVVGTLLPIASSGDASNVIHITSSKRSSWMGSYYDENFIVCGNDGFIQTTFRFWKPGSYGERNSWSRMERTVEFRQPVSSLSGRSGSLYATIRNTYYKADGSYYSSGSGEQWYHLTYGGEVMPTLNTYNGRALLAKALDEANPVEPGYFSQLDRDAVSSIRLESNSIANALEFAGYIDTLKDVFMSGPKSLIKNVIQAVTPSKRAFASAWLSYRYVYNTTKADVEDFIDKFSGAIFQNGRVICRAGGMSGDYQCHVKTVLLDRYSNKFAEFHKSAMKYGFALTPYNIYDMVPFSFIVDWFCPIGTALEGLDADYYYHTRNFEVLSRTISSKLRKEYTFGNDHITVTSYSRTVSSFVPFNQWYESNPSTKTVAYRCLDAASLLLG